MWRSHGERYLEMSFKDFVEGFDIRYDERIWWLISPSSLMDGIGMEVDNKDVYNVMILKLRTQRSPRRVYLMLSHSSIPPKHA